MATKKKPIVTTEDFKAPEDLVVELPEVTSEVTEVVEAPVEPVVVVVTPSKAASTYVVQDGDTYASLGEKFKVIGQSKHDKARAIHSANGGKTLRVGDQIVL